MKEKQYLIETDLFEISNGKLYDKMKCKNLERELVVHLYDTSWRNQPPYPKYHTHVIPHSPITTMSQVSPVKFVSIIGLSF